MLKKIVRGMQEVKNAFLKRMNSKWHKMSRGAQEISRVITSAHKDQWRRQGNYQKNHDKNPHNCHKRR